MSNDEVDLPDVKKYFTPRNIGRVVVSTSVRFVIVGAITSLVPVENRREKIKLFVGSYVVAELVVDKAKTYFDDWIDEKTKNTNEIEEFEVPKVVTYVPEQ